MGQKVQMLRYERRGDVRYSTVTTLDDTVLRI